MVKQFDVVLVNLDPAQGSEYAKTRPCVVVSPTDMNASLKTVIIAPLTSKKRGWAFRPVVTGKHSSELACDQLRAIDQTRIIKTLGVVAQHEQANIKSVLQQMFA